MGYCFEALKAFTLCLVKRNLLLVKSTWLPLTAFRCLICLERGITGGHAPCSFQAEADRSV